ncbi:MAG: GTP-binding protein [Pseudomonadota bacterium]
MTDAPGDGIPFTVLGGYLGAGKTTLLNRLLHALAPQQLRIGLLINDFGAINIDAGLIETRTDEQINLTNGCVCCGLADGFDAAIEGLLASDPPFDHLIVEASGVADVFTLAQYGHAPGLRLDGILVVADAHNVRRQAADKYVANTVRRQLAAADLIVLNKLDLLQDAREREALTGWLLDLAPNAAIVPATRCDVPLALLLHTHDAHQTISPAASAQAADGAHAHADHYASWSYSGAGRCSRAAIEAFVAGLPREVLRGKGTFAGHDGDLLWQRVGSHSSLQPIDYAAGTAIAIIARELDTARLDALARSWLE